MKPIKFKAVAEETAQRLSRPVEEVEALLQIYFKELRSALTGLVHPRVQVFNLGTFQIRETRIQRKRAGKQALLEQGTAYQDDLLQDIERMERMLSMLQSEKDRKHSIRQNREVGHE